MWGRETQLPAAISWLHPDASSWNRGTYHVVSELNEHGLLLRLVEAYRQTGNRKYARHTIDLMLDWLRTCTPFPRATDFYSDRTDVWYNPGHSQRVANWSRIFYALRRCPAVGDDALITVLKTIFREQAYKRGNYQGNPNHIVTQLVGFVHFATWWPEFKAARQWALDAVHLLDGALDDFFYPDGAYVELCYLGVYQSLVDVCRLADEHNYPLADDFAQRLSRAFDFLLYSIHPRGFYPGWNDAGMAPEEGEPPAEMGGLIALGAEFTDRDDLRGVNTYGRQGALPTRTSHHFPYAGFFVMRTDWSPQAHFLMLDGGRNLGGCQHPHMDQLSFVLAAHGHTLITDTCYGGHWYGRWRQEYYVATPGHNAIAVDDQWQAQYPEDEPQHNERWSARPMIGNCWSVHPGRVTGAIVSCPPAHNRWSSGAQFDYARSIYDQGFTRDPQSQPDERLQVSHERRILFLKPDYWIVTDILRGSGTRDFEAYFHCPTTAELEAEGLRLDIRHHGARLQLIPLCVLDLAARIVAGQHQPIQGWMPDGWGEQQPAPTIVVSGRTPLPLTMHTLLVPSPADKKPQVHAAFLEEDVLEIMIDGKRDLYASGIDAGISREIGEWTFAGEVSAVRFDEVGTLTSQFQLD